MRRPRMRVVVATLLTLSAASSAEAGGPEFPGGGTRSLGRGGAAMARADDPSVMARNPALLADLWDDQVLLGAHLSLVDACFRATGNYGWGVVTQDVFDLGEGPIYVQAQAGDTTLDGRELRRLVDRPYAEVCHEGPAPFLPQVAISAKLTPDLGVGLGFFPPDNAGLAQWGNRDGSVDTRDGKLPNPLRFLRSHQNASFFTLLGGVGYRLSDLVRVGLALQWNLAIFEVTAWTTPQLNRDYHNDIRTDVFGRDLFIPAFVASVQVEPSEELAVALGFKWADRVRSKVKLDITAGRWGTGGVFEYEQASGDVVSLGGAIPRTSFNQAGVVDSPPIWVPQLTLAVRYADRLKPAPPKNEAGRAAAGGVVDDALLTERWDVELDAVYYFNSAYDQVSLTNTSAVVTLVTVAPTGEVSEFDASVGKCIEPVASPTGGTPICPPGGARRVTTVLGGKDQLTLRAGGDYNLLPGLLALRAGASYELAGQEIGYHTVLNYMQDRLGLHAGLTVRIAGKTDLSLGFAHFFQRDLRLQVNAGANARPLERPYKTDEYNFMPGAGVPDAMNAGANAGGFDGNAQVEVPNGTTDEGPAPYYVNAGSYFYHLDVLSLSVAQHF